MVRFRPIPWLTGFLLFWLAAPAAAFKMTPIELTFPLEGRETRQSVVLQNETAEPAAIEITVHKRTMTRDGKDVLDGPVQDFLVVPSQVVLMPGRSQTVRIQWQGQPVEQEAAYRLIAEQLAVDIGEAVQQGGRMRLLVRYEGALYVKPDGTAHDVTVESAVIRQDGGKASMLDLSFHNKGTAHVGLSDLSLEIKRNGASLAKLAPDALEGVSGENLLAGHRRDFTIALPQPVDPGPADVSFDFTPR